MLKTIGSIALLFVAAPVLAQPGDAAVPSIHVSYADLDLGTAAGVTELDHRLSGAVSAACDVTGSRELARLAAGARCRATARAMVHAQREAAVAQAQTNRRLASVR